MGQPQIIFTHWREVLNQLRLDYQLRRVYAQAIEAYLDYCRLNGQSVEVETAREFMEDALRRGLAGDEAQWKEGLNWFFRKGVTH